MGRNRRRRETAPAAAGEPASLSLGPALSGEGVRGTNPRAASSPARTDRLVLAALFFATLLLYVPSFSHPFLDFDDPKYIHENPIVRRGLSLEGVRWAFTTNQFSNWLPVTWLSHMLDCQLFGMDARGHHVTSAVLHACNAALVFLVFHAMTGPASRWRAGAVAALFAAHPLRVESVSWIAERKDVLCATFFLLTLLAYARYTRRPGTGRYALVLLLYALGLMSKTMIVTLPCVLLLLDYWPLRRFRFSPPADPLGSPAAPLIRTPDAAGQSPPTSAAAAGRVYGAGRLVLEKVPLLLLALVSSAWTVVLQRQGNALESGRELDFAQRLGNALVSVPRYLGKTVRPVELSAFYPHPGSWPAWQVAASAALVVTASVAALAWARRKPYFAVGWFWFLGMLVPVSGLAVQAGAQSMADRYTYLPSIGLLAAAVWAAADFARGRPRVRPALVPVAASLLALFALATLLQQRYWGSTRDLFEQAAAVDPGNWYAHGMLGFYHSNQGDEVTALAHYEKALAAKPDSGRLWLNSGMSLYLLGRTDEAIRHYRRALETVEGPASFAVHFHLATALARKGDHAAAVAEFREAARLAPDHAGARAGAGKSLAALGRKQEAAEQFVQALRLDPSNSAARAGLNPEAPADGKPP